MHFGLTKHKSLLFLFISAIAMNFTSSCKGDAYLSDSIGFNSPQQGQLISLGTAIKIKLDVPQGMALNSATYMMDGNMIAIKNNADSILIPTHNLSVGYKLITAIIDNGNKKDTIAVNVVLKPGTKPLLYTYTVNRVLPHDTSSYTQGLTYHDNKFLESTGLEGSSTLRWVDLLTGKAIHRVNLDKKYFGEGSTLVGDKVIMLTWQSNIGLVYDAKTLIQRDTFAYENSREGWGICYDGLQLIKSDGSNKLYFLNRDTYKEERLIEVYDNEGTVSSLNELEYIDGKVYANVYTKDYILVIDPKSGIVEKKIDLTGLLEKGYNRTASDTRIDVLNGIAWDDKGRKLYVTGKRWPKLFEITLVPQ